MWDSAAEASRWWEQAENDLEFARMALREEFFHQACFIAQQSAEKAVKAIGYRLGDRTILGHSVVVLRAMPSRCRPSPTLTRKPESWTSTTSPPAIPMDFRGACRSPHSMSHRPELRSKRQNGL